MGLYVPIRMSSINTWVSNKFCQKSKSHSALKWKNITFIYTGFQQEFIMLTHVHRVNKWLYKPKEENEKFHSHQEIGFKLKGKTYLELIYN